MAEPSHSTDTTTGGMTALFVRRPVLAIVLNLMIVVAGLAALLGVEIRELPEVDSPVVTVRTDYQGAAPETIDREITARIEGAAGRVAGVKSISSTSNFGRSTVTVEFSGDTDIDVAATDLKDAIARIQRDLPDGADDSQVVKTDDGAQAIMRLAVTSDRLSVQDMTILVEDEIADRLAAVPGVADVQVYGDRAKIFRIDIDQSKLAAHGLTVVDLAGALSSAAFDAPAGSLTSNTQDLVVRATAAISSPQEFEDAIIRGQTRIGDVATVSLGADIGQSALRANGKTGVGMGILRQAGSNTLAISRGVRAAVEELRPALPEGVEIRVTSDDARFISRAIDEVIYALTLSTLIVIGVIFLFLLDWRATLIPAVTLPVALTGAVAGLWIAGLSVNILTLLALVLATGMVVDDAIVVLENIVTTRSRGLGGRAAAVLGTREVFFAVIATTATLAAVFVPIAFLPGKTGALFREFGIVLAIAVLLSSVVALTLAPMLASRLFAASGVPQHTGLLARTGRGATALYGRLLRGALNAPSLVVLAAIGFSVAAWLVFSGLRQELTPTEDRALVILSVTAPQGVSIDYTASQLRRVEALAQPFVETGEVQNVFSIAGRGGQANSGFVVLTLAPWDERQKTQQQIAAALNQGLNAIPGLRAFVIQTNSLGIRGAGSGLQVALAGDDYDELAGSAQRLADAMEADPRFGRVRLSYETTQPQLSIAIDRERATQLGVNIDGLAPAVQAMLDGRSAGEVFVGDRAIEIKFVSTASPINDPTDLENIFLKAADGRFIPMSSISTLTEKAVAPSLGREQKLRAVSVTASLTPDFALGSALAEAERMAEPLLPPGGRVIPLAEAATLEETSNGILWTFGFAIVIVLLVLAAQFESFLSAIIIMLTVPLGLGCAAFAMLLTGTSLNVYSQIGLVLLVGVMAKNGILIVEFANQLRDRGASVREAVEQAAQRRLRPVMMTMVSTVLGALPLILGSGAGAEARIALGWVIVGGLGLATLATLFVTPVGFLLLAGLSKPRAAEEARLQEELDAAAGHAQALAGE